MTPTLQAHCAHRCAEEAVTGWMTVLSLLNDQLNPKHNEEILEHRQDIYRPEHQHHKGSG